MSTIFLTSAGLRYRATIDGNSVTIDGTTNLVTQAADGGFQVNGADGPLRGVAAISGDTVWVSIAGHVFEFQAGTTAAPARSASRDEDALTPLMAATVVKIHVKPGDRVQEGDTLVTLEAMKMEMAIRAPRAAEIAAVHCVEGELAQPGAPVIELKP